MFTFWTLWHCSCQTVPGHYRALISLDIYCLFVFLNLSSKQYSLSLKLILVRRHLLTITKDQVEHCELFHMLLPPFRFLLFYFIFNLLYSVSHFIYAPIYLLLASTFYPF